LPHASAADRLALVRNITAGNLGPIPGAGHDAASVRASAVASLATGYHALFLAGALFMLVSTILTWCLVRAAETPPVSTSARRPRQRPADYQ
jgi:hypothetical protein